MKALKFTKHHDKYAPGDIAGFDDEKADWLVNKIKVAEPVAKGEDAQAAKKTTDKA